MDLPRQNAALELDATARRVDDMVWIPGGTFRMDRDRGDGRLAGSVRAFVSGFWMDRAPVTVRQFGEFVGSNSGIGYVLQRSIGTFDLPTMFAALVILALLGVVLFWIVDRIERLVVPWHVSQREDIIVAA